jgi:hypothetical protein
VETWFLIKYAFYIYYFYEQAPLEQATRLTRLTDSQQVVPTSMISSARNKLLTSWWQQARIATCYEQPVSCWNNLLQICYRHQPCDKVITTCSRLVTTTGNKQCEHILISAWQQPCYNLFADLKQLVCFYACIRPAKSEFELFDVLKCRVRFFL